MANKTLDRLSKLLAQAENAGTPEEAATFMEKAQAMSTTTGIELAVARAHQASKERAVPEKNRKVLVNPWQRKYNRKLFAELAMALCAVNDVQYLISGNEYCLFTTGFSTDIDMVEALYTHLQIQMVSEADAALARGDNKELVTAPKRKRVDITPAGIEEWEANLTWERANAYYDGRLEAPTWMYEEIKDAEGNLIMEEKLITRVDGRVFRAEFYTGFIRRMESRLWEAKRAAEKEAIESRGDTPEASEVGMVLADKKEKVTEAFEEYRATVAHVGSYKGSWESDRKTDYSARAHGENAATRVPVGTEQRAI